MEMNNVSNSFGLKGNMDSFVPQIYQVPLVLVLIVLFGFLAVLGKSTFSAEKRTTQAEGAEAAEGAEGEDEAPRTPRKSRKKKGVEALGSVVTPQGRRSGRIMAKKED